MSSKYHGGNSVQSLCGCGKNLVAAKGIAPNGKRKYRSSCWTCIRKARAHKDMYCNNCGIVPKNKADLEVDHKDGNRANNRAKNLQTLCKPCHIAKTVKKADWRPKRETV